LIWVAEDKSLGRRILLWLRPVNEVVDTAMPAGVRPTRLRAVSAGDVLWNDRAYWWVGFVAPAGVPLPDAIDPEHPLAWADARPLIEQVVDELVSAAGEGTLPGRVGVDQIWAEPSGRVHLLDFPVPTATGSTAPAGSPLGLVRQVTTLLLEGNARDGGGRVAAPIPPHASGITDRLFDGDNPFKSVGDVEAALAESHAHPPRVTSGMRAAHLGLTGMLTGTGLAALFAAVVAYHFLTAVIVATQAGQVRLVRELLDDPEAVSALAADPDLADYLAPDQVGATVRRVDSLESALRAETEAQKRRLTRPERYLIDRLEQLEEKPDRSQLPPAGVARAVLSTAQREARQQRLLASLRLSVLSSAVIVAALLLPAFVAFALVFRGGLSFVLAGLTIVRRDGRRAGRLRCGLRELLAWMPLFAVLLTCVWIQAIWPGWGFQRVFVTVVSIGALVASVAVALWYPECGPQDRIAGTYLVPA
jgi:hypothetical protein